MAAIVGVRKCWVYIGRRQDCRVIIPWRERQEGRVRKRGSRTE